MATQQRNGGGRAGGQRGNQRNGQQAERKPPVYEARIGRIKATVWENPSADGAWYSVTLVRAYRENKGGGEEGEWRTANSFGRDDLLICSEVMRLAFLWICAKQGAQGINLGDSYPDDDVPL